MKKYLCLVLIISLFILGCFSLEREMVSCVSGCNIDYEMIDDNTIKIHENNLQNFIKKLDISILRISDISDRKIMEGYTSKFDNYFIIDDLKINVQISIADGVAIIGSPLIFGSF